RYFVQIFDVALESWLGIEQGLCVFRETCGSALAIEHNGDLYSCDHYVYPENKLGNIIENPLGALVNSRQQRQVGQDKYDTLPRMRLSFCLQWRMSQTSLPSHARWGGRPQLSLPGL